MKVCLQQNDNSLRLNHFLEVQPFGLIADTQHNTTTLYLFIVNNVECKIACCSFIFCACVKPLAHTCETFIVHDMKMEQNMRLIRSSISLYHEHKRDIIMRVESIWKFFNVV